MSTKAFTNQLDFSTSENGQLARLTGALNANLRQIERTLGVRINNRGGSFRLAGESQSDVSLASRLLEQLYQESNESDVGPEYIQRMVVHLRSGDQVEKEDEHGVQQEDNTLIRTPKMRVKPAGGGQYNYVQQLNSKPLVFGVGVAGTGKTFLAIAMAVQALKSGEVKRLVLTRPAVEAGEKLGFLPGDLAQKIDPYLRPLYDALYDTLGYDSTQRLMENGTIEIAPLAYMRGRTLNEVYVVLDEAQNTTIEQMKMFLTRLGVSSRAVVTGDLSQVDLPAHITSGLAHAVEVLKDIDDIGICHFKPSDAMRHPLVRRIVEAYAEHDGD